MKNFSNLEPLDYIRIFFRRIWYFAGTVVLVGAGVGAYVWRMPSIYKSETTIVAVQRFIPDDYIGPFIKEGTAERIDSVRQQLYSRTFLERIVQEFQLTGNQQTGQISMESAVGSVLANMELQVVSANTFKLGYYSSSPETARAMTRRLAEAVIQLNESSHREKVQVADQFLDDQLRQAESEVADGEAKIAEFKRRHRDELPEQAVGNWNLIADLQNRLSSAENALQNATDQRKAMELRAEERRRVNLMMRSLSPAEPAGTTVGQAVRTVGSEEKALQDEVAKKKNELAALSVRYTDKFPDIARLKHEISDLETQISLARSRQEVSVRLSETTTTTQATASLPSRLPEIPDEAIDDAELRLEMGNLDNTIVKLQKERESLARQIANYRSRLNLPPDLDAEYQALTRDYETAKQRYNFLSGKKFSAELAITVDTSSKNDPFKILDEANLPEQPVRPDRFQLGATGALAAIVLGFGMAFVREFLDPTLGSEEEAATRLRLPVLVAVPEIPQLTGFRKKRLLEDSRPA